MPAKDFATRQRIAEHANRVRWAGCTAEQAAAATEPARLALRERFARQVDPDGTLDAATRAALAAEARSAHYTELARRSHAARRRNAERTAAA